MIKSAQYPAIILSFALGLMSCSELDEKKQVISDIVDSRPKAQKSKPESRAIFGKEKAKRVEKISPSAVFLKKTILSVKELIGKPDFTRKEGKAVVLQYQTELCILDIFFYGKKGAKVSTYFEFRQRNNIKIDIQKCINKMLSNKK